MKWLTTFLCLLAITPALADQHQEESSSALRLPIMVTCSSIPPEIILKQYDEIPFIEGIGSVVIPSQRSLTGEFRMFMSPDAETFTIMLTIDEIHCMIMSGESVMPSYRGDPL